jgi:predicted Fe-Mo cluster-binding NifX family protein
MKVCVTAQGDNLDAEVDARFGRCGYFVFVNTDTYEYEAVPNPNTEAMGGAGIQSGQFVAGKEVKAVITGNVGPNAFQTLQAAGIEVITGVSGTVKEAIEKYKQGGLKASSSPSVKTKGGLPSRDT